MYFQLFCVWTLFKLPALYMQVVCMSKLCCSPPNHQVRWTGEHHLDRFLCMCTHTHTLRPSNSHEVRYDGAFAINIIVIQPSFRFFILSCRRRTTLWSDLINSYRSPVLQHLPLAGWSLSWCSEFPLVWICAAKHSLSVYFCSKLLHTPLSDVSLTSGLWFHSNHGFK